jgi:putative PIN family toxin of toxin-antitoxin system
LAKLCVVLDTQLLLRGATARRATLNKKVYQAWVRGEYDLLLSQETLDEILRVLADAEVVRKLRVTDEILVSTAILLTAKAKFVNVTRKITMCRDPHDDKFLECAVAGKADYVVSADEDLLSLRIFEGIPIVNLPTFWRKLQEGK